MAVDAVDVADAHRTIGKGDDPSTRGKEKAGDNLAVSIRRSALLRIEGTGRVNDEFTGRESGSKPEWVGLDKEIHKKYVRFLKEHADHLKILNEQHPEVLESDLHAHDKKLLERFTTETIVEGGEAVKTVDEKKIADFLKTNGGWMFTTQLLEQEAAFMLAAIGLAASTNPGGARGGDLARETGSHLLDMGRGPLNMPFRRLRAWLTHPTGEFAGRRGDIRILNSIRFPNWWMGVPHAPGDPGTPRHFPFNVGFYGQEQNRAQTIALLSTLSGLSSAAAMATGLGEAGAAAATLAIWGSEGLALAIGNGVVMDFKRSNEMLQAIQADDKESQYVETMFGINVRNPAKSITHVDDLTKHLVDEILPTRLEFYKKIGVPPKNLDALPEQYIYNNTNRPEQTSAEWAARIQEKLTGQRALMAGDVTGNLQRYWNARSEVMTEMLQEMIRNEAGSKISYEGARATVKQKLSAREEAGTFKRSRAVELTNQNTRMEQDKGLMDRAKSKPTEYRDAAKGLAQVRLKALRDYSVSDINSINNLIKTKNNQIYDIKDGSSWAARKAEIDNEEKLELKARIDEIARTFGAQETREEQEQEQGQGQGRGRQQRRRGTEARKSPPQIAAENDARANVRASYDQKRADLAEETKTVREREIAELRTLKDSIQRFEDQLRGDGDLSRLLEDQFKAFRESYNEISGIGLTEDDLANAKIIDEITAKINQRFNEDVANGVAPADIKGWREDNNGNEANREKVLQAMIEARARKKASEDGQRDDRVRDFNSVIDTSGGLISEGDLRTLTPENALTELNMARVARGLTLLPVEEANLDFIRSAIQEAKDRLPVDIAAQTVDELSHEADRIIKTNNYEIDNIDITKEVGILKVADELMERFDPIITGRMKIFDNPAATARFTDTASATGDATYSAEEQAAGFTKGYYETLDLLFGYKSKANRGEEFRRISGVVSQDAIRTVMGASLWGLEGVPVDFNEFLTHLRTDITEKTITEREMRRALFAIINRYKDEALGI